MNHTQYLEDKQLTFAEYRELLSINDLDKEYEAFLDYYDDNIEEFSNLEFAICEILDELYVIAKEYLEGIARTELNEELQDQGKYN
jgi:hypothetical protein